VLFHDKESRGALAYLALAGEMIRREEEVQQPAPAASATDDSAGPARVLPASAAAGSPPAAEPGTGDQTDPARLNDMAAGGRAS